MKMEKYLFIREERRERLVFYFCLSVVGGVFGWYFFNTFICSTSYEFLVLRNIDGLYYHRVLEAHRNLIFEGHWAEYFAQTSFGYGNIFWQFMQLVTFPSYLWGPEWLTIVIPRWVSLASYYFCVRAFYLMARAVGFSRLDTMLGLLMLCTCSLPVIAATRFHNYTIVAALIMWSYYLLIKPEGQSRWLIAVLLFALALEIKPSTALFFPLFIFLMNKNWRDRGRLRTAFDVLKVNIVTSATIGAVAFLGIVPLLLWATGNGNFFSPMLALFSKVDIVNAQLYPLPMNAQDSLKENFFTVFYHEYVFAAGLGISLFMAAVKTLIDKKMPWIALAAVVSTVTVGVMAHSMDKVPNSLQSYALVPVFIFTLVFVQLSSRFKFLRLGIVGLMLWNVQLNWHYIKNNNMAHFNIFRDPENLKKIERYKFYEENIEINDYDSVAMGAELVFPIRWLERADNVQLMHDSESDLTGIDIVIFDKTDRFWDLTCDEVEEETSKASAYCKKLKQASSGVGSFRKVFEDDQIRIVRRVQ